jgi:hypothetical protein
MKTLTLSSPGGAALRWSARPAQAWIIASPGAGTVGDAPGALQVQVDRTLLGRGPATGSIVMETTTSVTTVRVTVD